MRRIALLLLSLCTGSVFADPPPDYYGTAEDRTGQALRTALHGIIRNHRVIPYSSTQLDTSDALKVLDQDAANTNNVRLIYAQRLEPKANFPSVWNREHLWPNSYGLDDSGPEYSDLFNLRAEDETVNSARGNKLYDESGSLSAHAEAPLCSTDSNSWEPPATMKGDIARAMFYMDVRYEGTGGEPDLILTDRVNDGSVNSATNLMGRLTTLLQWHFADPVDDAERLRNDKIYSSYQNNRNPFVDRPEWVAAVFVPPITISQQGAEVLLTWPSVYVAGVVQECPFVGGPWRDLRAGGALSESRWGVSFPMTNTSTLYRLRLE